MNQQSELKASLLWAAKCKRRELLISIAAGIAIGTVAVFLIPKKYKAQAVVLPAQQQSAASSLLQSLSALSGIVGGPSVRSTAEQYAAYLDSARIENKIIKEFGLSAVYDIEDPDDTRKELRANTTLNPTREGTIEITVVDQDQKRAAAIANKFVTELESLLDEWNRADTGQRRKFFEQQLQRASKQLADAQIRLAQSGVPPSASKMSPEVTIGAISELQAQLTAKEIELQALLNRMTPASPDIQSIKSEIGALKGAISASKRQSRGAEENPYVDALRDFKYAESLFQILAKQFELARIDEADAAPQIVVLDRATAATKHFFPRRSIVYSVAMLVSLIAYTCFAFLSYGKTKKAA